MNLGEAKKVMGLTHRISDDELKKLYKKLSLSMHPDINKASNATEMFQTLQQAYFYMQKNMNDLPNMAGAPRVKDKPLPPKPVPECKVVYFVLKPGPEHVVRVPNHLMGDGRLKQDLKLYFQWEGQEFYTFFARGCSVFPFVRNFSVGISIHFLPETYSNVYFEDLGRRPPEAIQR
jgi:hypothetical protein